MRRVHFSIKHQTGSQSLVTSGNTQNPFLYHISKAVFDRKVDPSHLISNHVHIFRFGTAGQVLSVRVENMVRFQIGRISSG